MFRTLVEIWTHELSRRTRFQALSRYLRWQFAVRVIRCPIVVPFVDDAVLVVERSMTGATKNVYCGLHEFNDMGFVLHVLRPDDTFLDIGANVGSYTILASQVVGARSISIEPAPDAFRFLQRNLRCNAVTDRVELLNCGVGPHTGALRFSVDLDTMNHVVDDNYSGVSSMVPIRSLDDVLKGRPSHVWKVDVEGFEKEVLEGGSDSLRNPALIAVLLEGDNSSIRQKMHESGFVLKGYNPNTRRLIEFNDPFAIRGRSNNLWVRDVAEVQRRCESARAFTVHGSEI
jgi:FkbM family methyltransferase